MVVANPRVNRDVVFNLPDIPYTDTWHPVPHRMCIESVDRATKNLGIKIQDEFYSLSKDGHQMYGAWTIGNGDTKEVGSDTLFQCIIFRNATNKYHSFGINGGTNAYICENLVIFFERFVEFRRHTGGLDENELDRVVTKGVSEIIPKLSGIRVWQNALHNVKLREVETRALAYDAINKGIISKQRIPQFDKLLFDEGHTYNPRELFGFHGAITETMRDLSMTGGFINKQNKLHSFIIDRFGHRLPTMAR
ncbi:MAG: hypothetical protein ACTSQY_09490 [Candidatus Odinarchaeia archaeon]